MVVEFIDHPKFCEGGHLIPLIALLAYSRTKINNQDIKPCGERVHSVYRYLLTSGTVAAVWNRNCGQYCIYDHDAVEVAAAAQNVATVSVCEHCM